MKGYKPTHVSNVSHLCDGNCLKEPGYYTTMDDLYVVEIAATGAKGLPADAVAEAAVCLLPGDGSEFETVFCGRVLLDPLDIGKEALDHLEAEYGITAESLYAGDPEEEVSKGLQEAIYGKECCSYDVGFTFGRFLSFEPWDMAREVEVLPSYRLMLPDTVKGESVASSIIAAYDAMFPDDDAGILEDQGALRLAQMSASIVQRLRGEGLYRTLNLIIEPRSTSIRDAMNSSP